MTLSLIWAMADNRVIGIENRLPWKLPADMKWFRQNTMSKPIIMGRLTFESFGAKPLPSRRNIIISRNPLYTARGTDVYTSLEDALQSTQDSEETMIIGGMSLYKQALPLADRLYMTLVHANVAGDAWFPAFDLREWQKTARSDFPADEKNPHAYSFITLDKQPGACTHRQTRRETCDPEIIRNGLMRTLLLQIATGCLCLSGVLNTQASEVFPENIFVTLKNSGEIARYGEQSIWKGDPVMLYNAITPDGQHLVVSSPKTGNVYLFDASTHKRLAKIKVGKAPKGLKVSPDGKEVYVANEAEATVSVVDLLNYKTVTTIKVDETPHNIRFSNDGKWAYVTLQGGAGLGVIDTQTRQYVKVIPTPGIPNPHNLDISKDGKTVYIRDLGNTVGVLDLISEKMKKVITVGQGHAGIDITPDEKYIFTGAIADDVVTVIDAQSLNVIKKIKVGFGPHGVRSSKNGRWLYVAITAEDKFVIIDTQTFDIVQTHSLPSFPFWIAVNGNP